MIAVRLVVTLGEENLSAPPVAATFDSERPLRVLINIAEGNLITASVSRVWR